MAIHSGGVPVTQIGVIVPSVTNELEQLHRRAPAVSRARQGRGWDDERVEMGAQALRSRLAPRVIVADQVGRFKLIAVGVVE